MPMLIGTSGWQYRDWRGGLYPEGGAQGLWLGQFANHHTTAENNNSFDRRGRPITPLWRTATWGYLRFHEGTAQPWPSYGPQALRSWVARLTETWPDEADVYVYFNNDPGGAAVINSAQFADLARQAGRSATRTPDVGQVAATAAIPTW